MKKMIKRCICWILAPAVLLTATMFIAANATESNTTSWAGGVPGQELPEGVTLMADNEKFSFALKREQSVFGEGEKATTSTLYSVEIIDKAANVTYSSLVPLDYYGSDEQSKVLRDGLSKMFSVSISDFGSRSEVLHTSAVNTVFHYDSLDNGAKLYIYFPSRDIGLTAYFTIDTNGLSVRVPKDGLVEGGKYGILSIDVLPVFGAVRSGEDGYILFPDGSGAIYEIPDKATSQKLTTMDVYSSTNLDLDALESNRQQGINNIMLPVFGVKNGNTALLGVLTEGESYAQVNLAPGGHIYGELNRIYPTFRYRKSFKYQTTNDMEAYTIEKESRLGDIGVRYFFLSGEDADYSGMARTYREWLLQEGKLKKSGLATPVVSATFLGGVNAASLLGDSLEVFSEFEGITEIMQKQIEQGRNRFLLTVAGWQKSGYGVYPAHLPVASALGGKNGLQKLTELLSANHIPLLLSDNFLQVNQYGSRTDSQIIYDYLNLPISDAADENYLLNPQLTEKEVNEALELCQETGVSLLFEKYGSLLYEDYSTKHEMTRTEMADTLAKTLTQTKQQTGIAAASGGNAYLLNTVDWLADLPITASGHLIFDYDIPFYQMVVHGSIAYAPTLPGNMATDFQREKLYWLETGSTPYFLLSVNSDDRLKYTIYQEPFSLHYVNWEETINQVYDEFAAISAHCNDVIQKHEIVNVDMRRITYENGCVMLLNYADTEKILDGQTVSAQGYLLLNEKGEIVCRG